MNDSLFASRARSTFRCVRRLEPWVWSMPLLFLLIPFFLLPIVAIFWVSFSGKVTSSTHSLDEILANYVTILTEPYYLSIYANTLGTAIGVTIATLVLGYPLAYHLVRWAGRWRGVLIWILYLPLIVSVIVRVFGWIVITADHGLINEILVELGVIQNPLRILYEVEAMVLAMTHRYLPLMVLPLANAIAKIDPELDRVATDLGAGRLRVMVSVTLPLSIPGIFAGSQLVFANVLSDFVMPSLVGTTRFPMMAPAIYEQAVMLINWPAAAAISTVLLTFILFYLALSVIGFRALAPWVRATS